MVLETCLFRGVPRRPSLDLGMVLETCLFHGVPHRPSLDLGMVLEICLPHGVAQRPSLDSGPVLEICLLHGVRRRPRCLRAAAVVSALAWVHSSTARLLYQVVEEVEVAQDLVAALKVLVALAEVVGEEQALTHCRCSRAREDGKILISLPRMISQAGPENFCNSAV